MPGHLCGVQLAELIPSFHHVGSGDHTGVVSFGSKCLCLLSHPMDSGSLTDLEYAKISSGIQEVSLDWAPRILLFDSYSSYPSRSHPE